MNERRCGSPHVAVLDINTIVVGGFELILNIMDDAKIKSKIFFWTDLQNICFFEKVTLLYVSKN